MTELRIQKEVLNLGLAPSREALGRLEEKKAEGKRVPRWVIEGQQRGRSTARSSGS